MLYVCISFDTSLMSKTYNKYIIRPSCYRWRFFFSSSPPTCRPISTGNLVRHPYSHTVSLIEYEFATLSEVWQKRSLSMPTTTRHETAALPYYDLQYAYLTRILFLMFFFFIYNNILFVTRVQLYQQRILSSIYI